MKLVLLCMLTVFAMSAEALSLKDLIPIVVGAGNGPSVGPVGPGFGPGGPGFPGRPGRPGRPGYPGGPGGGYPGGGYPGGGNVQCRANDRGWEEHSGGHFSCGECLQQHGECAETCSSVSVECRVDGTDNTGRSYSFMGRGYDQWRAQDDAMYACRSRYLNNCYVVNCQQRQEVVSRRDCRR